MGEWAWAGRGVAPAWLLRWSGVGVEVFASVDDSCGVGDSLCAALAHVFHVDFDEEGKVTVA